MNYLIILDAGHGMNTPGKSTPHFEDGSVMKEREFNRATVKNVIAMLREYDATTIWVSEEDTDVSLNTRAARANEEYNAFIKTYGKENVRSVFISIHANAHTGEWGNANGIETYFYPGAKDGEAFADVVQKRLVEVTKLRNRGIKPGDLAVLRDTKMTAILCECGFMDNKQEAKLLKSNQYREKCALAIVKGIEQYLNLQRIPLEDIDYEIKKIDIDLNGKIKTVSSINIDGNNFVKLRDLQDDYIKISYGDMPIVRIKC